MERVSPHVAFRARPGTPLADTGLLGILTNYASGEGIPGQARDDDFRG